MMTKTSSTFHLPSRVVDPVPVDPAPGCLMYSFWYHRQVHPDQAATTSNPASYNILPVLGNVYYIEASSFFSDSKI